MLNGCSGRGSVILELFLLRVELNSFELGRKRVMEFILRFLTVMLADIKLRLVVSVMFADIELCLVFSSYASYISSYAYFQERSATVQEMIRFPINMSNI